MLLVVIIGLLILVSTVASIIGVGWTRQIALRRQIIDIPNERSSHNKPTPRGGGLGIVLVVLAGALFLGITGQVVWPVVGAILVGGLVAFIGYVDDRGGLSPTKRALVHLIAAVVGLAILGGMPSLDVGFTVLEWGWLGQGVGVLGIIWMINLYNFMDGIDGLAGSQAVFVFGIGGLMLAGAGLNGLVLICALIAGANLGFLWWNWPPAKIFMGDVASGFLGYVIAIVAIASGNEGFSLWVWLILMGVFLVDTTITLVRRVLRGEKWYMPHRSHAYQHLTQIWHSHLRVTLAVLVINLLWLTPIAIMVNSTLEWAVVLSIVAIVPIFFLALKLGAGRSTPILFRSQTES